MKMHFKLGKPTVMWKQGQARGYGVYAYAHMRQSFSKGIVTYQVGRFKTTEGKQIFENIFENVPI